MGTWDRYVHRPAVQSLHTRIKQQIAQADGPPDFDEIARLCRRLRSAYIGEGIGDAVRSTHALLSRLSRRLFRSQRSCHRC